jgi:hypothetical protein
MAKMSKVGKAAKTAPVAKPKAGKKSKRDPNLPEEGTHAVAAIRLPEIYAEHCDKKGWLREDLATETTSAAGNTSVVTRYATKKIDADAIAEQAHKAKTPRQRAVVKIVESKAPDSVIADKCDLTVAQVVALRSYVNVGRVAWVGLPPRGTRYTAVPEKGNRKAQAQEPAPKSKTGKTGKSAPAPKTAPPVKKGKGKKGKRDR